MALMCISCRSDMTYVYNDVYLFEWGPLSLVECPFVETGKLYILWLPDDPPFAFIRMTSLE